MPAIEGQKPIYRDAACRNGRLGSGSSGALPRDTHLRVEELEAQAQLKQLGGGEQDRVERLHHVRAELHVGLDGEDVGQTAVDVLGVQQHAQPPAQSALQFHTTAFIGPAEPSGSRDAVSKIRPSDEKPPDI